MIDIKVYIDFMFLFQFYKNVVASKKIFSLKFVNFTVIYSSIFNHFVKNVILNAVKLKITVIIGSYAVVVISQNFL